MRPCGELWAKSSVQRQVHAVTVALQLLGIEHVLALDALFELSFETVERDCVACLGDFPTGGFTEQGVKEKPSMHFDAWSENRGCQSMRSCSVSELHPGTPRIANRSTSGMNPCAKFSNGLRFIVIK